MIDDFNPRRVLLPIMSVSILLAACWMIWQLLALMEVASAPRELGKAGSSIEEPLEVSLPRTTGDGDATGGAQARSPNSGGASSSGQDDKLVRPSREGRPGSGDQLDETGARLQKIDQATADGAAAVWGVVTGLPSELMKDSQVVARRQTGGADSTPVIMDQVRIAPPASPGAAASYAIANLPRGQYSICLEIGGGRGRECKDVALDFDARMQIDFGFTGAASVEGQLLGWTGGTDGKAELVLTEASQGAHDVVAVAPIASDGSFVLPFLPPGDYLAHPSGGFPIKMSVSASGRNEVVLAMASGEIHGRIERSDGGKLASATVRATRRSEEERDARSSIAHTDDAGAFEFTGLPGGVYDIFADSSDGAHGTADAIGVNEGATVYDVVVPIASGGSLQVTLTDSAGAPIHGATMYCQDLLGFYFEVPARGDPGMHQLANMSRGAYRLVAAAGGIGVLGMDSVTIRDQQTTTLTLAFPAAGNPLRVIVRAGGAAVAGAKITILDSSGRSLPDVSRAFAPALQANQTDGSGSFSSAAYPAGALTVRVQSPDGASGEQSVPLDGSGSIVEVVFDL